MIDHDQRLKVLLKEFVGDFFATFLPAWAERLDFSAVEWLDTEVFSDPPAGERRAVDLAAKPACKQAPPTAAGPGAALGLIHVEVESAGSAAAMRARMFDYFTARRRHRLPVSAVVLFLRTGLDGVGHDEFAETSGNCRCCATGTCTSGCRPWRPSRSRSGTAPSESPSRRSCGCPRTAGPG
jgi:hypothetical protein